MASAVELITDQFATTSQPSTASLNRLLQIFLCNGIAMNVVETCMVSTTLELYNNNSESVTMSSVVLYQEELSIAALMRRRASVTFFNRRQLVKILGMYSLLYWRECMLCVWCCYEQSTSDDFVLVCEGQGLSTPQEVGNECLN